MTPAQYKVLRNLIDGREPWGHLYGQSQHGGAAGTAGALFRRGWVTDLRCVEITDAGRQAFEQHQSKGA